MNFVFRVATRFLLKNKGQTLLISLGIGIGIAVLIFIGSLIEGLQIDLLDSTIGNSPHITIENGDKNEYISDYKEIEAIVKSRDEIKAVSPNITRGAFLEYDDEFIQILYRGFEFKRADEIYGIEESILEGGTTPENNQVLIGETIASENNIGIGDTVILGSPETETKELEVSGFLDLKVASLNESWVVGDIGIGRDVFELSEGEISSLEMQIDDPFQSDTISSELNDEISRSGIELTEWKSSNEQLLSGLSGQSTSSLMIQIFVIISVVLGIASVLAITVMQKSRQIGILKAMGVKDSTASFIFLTQGFIFGLLGGIIGIALGIGLLFVFSEFALNPDGTPIVPIYIDPVFIVISGLISVVSSTIASVIPAIKSKNLSPIEVIRNG